MMNSLVSDWEKRDMLKRIQKEELNDFMKTNDCSELAELVELGKTNKLKTIFKVRNWDTLVWSFEELRKRQAIPLGATYHDANYAYPKRKAAGKDIRIIHFFGIAPTEEDPNTYSIHCQFPSRDVCHMQGTEAMSRLIDINCITGFSNGVEDFYLGPFDIVPGLHRHVPAYLKDIHELLSVQSSKRKAISTDE